jgi:hypothetical protein
VNGDDPGCIAPLGRVRPSDIHKDVVIDMVGARPTVENPSCDR